MKGILLKTPMVIAIKEDRKNQTRRTQGLDAVNNDLETINWQFECFETVKGKLVAKFSSIDTPEIIYAKPRYHVGEIIYVKESFSIIGTDITRDRGSHAIINEQHQYVYRGQKQPHIEKLYKWKSPLFMPQTAARIFLEVTNVRVEQIGDISESDAIAEGIEEVIHSRVKYPDNEKSWKNYLSKYWFTNPKLSYQSLWHSINGSYNPDTWVFVYEFKRMEKPNNR